MTPQGAWLMSVFGLSISVFGLLLVGFFFVMFLPWAIRAIGRSLEELRTNPEDSDSRW